MIMSSKEPKLVYVVKSILKVFKSAKLRGGSRFHIGRVRGTLVRDNLPLFNRRFIE